MAVAVAVVEAPAGVCVCGVWYVVCMFMCSVMGSMYMYGVWCV